VRRQPVIIDTDCGIGLPGSVIDDGLAIALALTAPEIEVLGITAVNGNADVHSVYRSVSELLRRLGRTDVPVLHGAVRPLRQKMEDVWRTFGMPFPERSSVTNVGDAPTDKQAAAWMVEAAAARPGDVTIAAIGPLTNVAYAIKLDSDFASNVKEIVVMAGNATGHVENITVVEDFNVFVDPDAMAIVLDSCVPVRMIGIDQTSRVRMNLADAELLRDTPSPASGDEVRAWLADCVASWIDIERLGSDRDARFCLLHDPLVIAAVAHPEICTYETRGHNLIAAVDTDVAAFRSLFFRRLATL